MENNKNLWVETINLLEKNSKTWLDVTDVFIIRTYLDFIDLKVPELSVEEPKLFNFFNHEYVGD
jgi:hypothetical protein